MEEFDFEGSYFLEGPFQLKEPGETNEIDLFIWSSSISLIPMLRAACGSL
jgi:hypothetical protein